MKRILLLASLLAPLFIASQSYSPDYKRTITIQNDSAVTLTNYQVLLDIATDVPIGAGHMSATGDDIRFSADSCNPSIYYDYWIESGINTSSTQIWINIPALNPLTSTDVIMWYGDSTASAASNFSATFPSALVTGGTSTTQTGTIDVGWLQVDVGDTLYIQGGAPLNISARKTIIDGVIWGLGRGYAAPSGLGTGGGPGGGTAGASSGAAGGSYGGLGGDGGYDSGDPINMAGPVYGTINGMTIEMGSAGGSGSTVMGGNGGGAITVFSEYITVNGIVNVDGNQGVQPGGGQGGGGGAGGGVLVIADELQLSVSSTITASGGNGSVGTSTANDDGGGGGGGRLKAFHGPTFTLLGTILINGGIGGPNGTAAGGQNGGVGTVFDSTITFIGANVSNVGIEEPFTIGNPSILGLSASYCLNASPVTLSGTPSGGVFSGTGVSGNSFDPSSAGVGTTTVYYTIDTSGCTFIDSSSVLVNALPTPTASNGGTICEGSDLMLMSSGGITYGWTGPNSFSSTSQNPTITGATTAATGTYTVTVTDANTCSATSTTSATVLDCTGMEDNDLLSISIYPNPTVGNIWVETGEANPNFKVQIMDLSGRTLLEEKSTATGKMNLDLEAYPNGIYIIEVIIDQHRQNYKVIKQ